MPQPEVDSQVRITEEAEAWAFMAAYPPEDWNHDICVPVISRCVLAVSRSIVRRDYVVDAEDVTQLVLLELWDTAKRGWRGGTPAGFRSFVIQKAIWRSIDVIRGRNLIRKLTTDGGLDIGTMLLSFVDDGENTESLAIAGLICEDIVEVISKSDDVLKGNSLDAFDFLRGYLLKPDDLLPTRQSGTIELADRLAKFIIEAYYGMPPLETYEAYGLCRGISSESAKKRLQRLARPLRPLLYQLNELVDP